TPLLGYGAPHLSARGTSTLLNNALLSAHFRLADKLANAGFDSNSEIWSLPIPFLVKPGKEFIPSGHRAGREIKFTPDGLR
ncbi:MAG TPA: hypothetical protein VNO18_24700, partial [Xanthobacteraceae bacterium]|nr:hypothetical protein [Xanthobacteraceae bacterium]